VEGELLRWLAQVAPVALRVGGVLTFSPFLGDRAIPNRVKAGLLVMLTALIFPVAPAQPAPIGPVDWVQMVMGESLVGLLMGLSLLVVFEGMQFAGQFSGIQLGLSLATLFDPQSQADSTALSVFYNLVTLLIFLQLNVHHWLLRALDRSFVYLPVGSVVATQKLASMTGRKLLTVEPLRVDPIRFLRLAVAIDVNGDHILDESAASAAASPFGFSVPSPQPLKSRPSR